MGQLDGWNKTFWRYPMRASEFIREDASSGAVSSGSIATVSLPMGGIITRWPLVPTGKYANSRKKYKNTRNTNASR